MALLAYLSDLSHLLHSEDGVVGLLCHPLESCDELLRLCKVTRGYVHKHVQGYIPYSEVISRNDDKSV